MSQAPPIHCLFNPPKNPVSPDIHLQKCTLYQSSHLLALYSVSTSLIFPLNVSLGAGHCKISPLVLRYLALQCPLVLVSDFTASRRLKSSHCLPPTPTFQFHFNRWGCLLVLNLNGGFSRLLADNGVFVPAGILKASSPTLKILFPVLLSLNSKLHKSGKKDPKAAGFQELKCLKEKLQYLLSWEVDCVLVIYFYNYSIMNSQL